MYKKINGIRISLFQYKVHNKSPTLEQQIPQKYILSTKLLKRVFHSKPSYSIHQSKKINNVQ